MYKFVPMPSVSNVAAGSICSCHLPVGLTFEVLQIAYSGVTLAQLENIKVKADGKTIMQFDTGAQLDYLNQYYGRGAASGILNLWFQRPELTQYVQGESKAVVRGQFMTSLGTVGLQTLSIEIGVNAGAASPALEIRALQSAAQPVGLICKVLTFPRNFATSGLQEIDSIPKSGARIAAAHLFKADVSAAELVVNNVSTIDATKTALEELQTRFGRTPQTAVATHLDFLVDGNIRRALQTSGVVDLRVKPTIDTSGALTAVVEYLDGLGGL